MNIISKIISFALCSMVLLSPGTIFAKNISVIGIGRLGLCLALCLERAGHDVMGVDLSQDYIDQLNQKSFNSPEPNVNNYLDTSKKFIATTSLQEALDFGDVIFITVSTTYGTESYNFSMLNELLTKINDAKISNKNIVISSTLFPGYVENTAKNLLKDCSDITLSYSPPFIAQGEIMKGLLYPDMILVGEGSEEAGVLLEEIYRSMCPTTEHIQHMSVQSAEITKFAVNCFITAKIAYANLVADIADETPGADKVAILNAVGKDTRIGSKCLTPGYGFGGPCFPRDNRGLGAYALTKGIEPVIFQATDIANKKHAEYMAEKLLAQDLPEYVFNDVAYKPNSPVPIIEESQKLAVAAYLANQGKRVVIIDRECVVSQVKKIYGPLFEYEIK